ncbi:hypothetical protein PQ465_20310 [Sphingobacterium oryzagri]|uniref:Uncharacterized protein n=1 Tax=Sphingobacterium oryzagri TaxID=3025669 RepID=A0ABY7WI57_9SPHI|nr:hypothetical protein [Sphingobacterium sp. KACC 22765]WDF68625.1 hypothetical protein PQ465_20310 [Sphingobacterium sp. KACC 22765]
MMTTISALLFLIGLCVITMGHAHAQKMLVNLVDSLTEATVTIAYIIPVGYNKGTITNEKSLVFIKESREFGISPVHYPDKRIRLAALGSSIHTMLIHPKKSIALAGFATTNLVDKTTLGIWISKKVATSKISNNRTNERMRYKPISAQAPAYRADQSFLVSVCYRPMIIAPSPGDKNQLHVKVAGANNQALAGLDSRLLGVAFKNHKRLTVNYQLPKSAHILEGV